MNKTSVIIVTLLSALMGLVYDWYIATIVWLAFIILTIVRNIMQEQRREQEMTIDRKEMMRGAQEEVRARMKAGKVTNPKEAMIQMKEDGWWANFMNKLKKQSPPSPTPETKPGPGRPQKKEEENTPPPIQKKKSWAFDESTTFDKDDTSVDFINKQGHDYVVLIRELLERGKNNWESRLEDLQSTQENMENIVANLKECYDEIKQEKQLVGHMIKLKKRANKEESTPQIM